MCQIYHTPRFCLRTGDLRRARRTDAGREPKHRLGGRGKRRGAVLEVRREGSPAEETPYEGATEEGSCARSLGVLGGHSAGEDTLHRRTIAPPVTRFRAGGVKEEEARRHGLRDGVLLRGRRRRGRRDPSCRRRRLRRR
jgi:hypothetical protein